MVTLLDWFTGNRTGESTQDISKTDSQSTSQTSMEKATNLGVTQVGSTQAGEKTSSQTQEAVSRQFSQPTLDALNALLQGTVGQVSPNGLSSRSSGVGDAAVDFAKLFGERALGADAALQKSIAPIMANSRKLAERNLTAGLTDLGTKAGSRLNSASILAEGIGRSEMESQLASTEAQLEMAARGQGTAEMTAASTALLNALKEISGAEIAGGSESLLNVARLASVLKGGEVTSTVDMTGLENLLTESQQTNQTANELSRIIESLAEGTTVTSGSTSGETSQSSTIFDVLRLFA